MLVLDWIRNFLESLWAFSLITSTVLTVIIAVAVIRRIKSSELPDRKKTICYISIVPIGIVICFLILCYVVQLLSEFIMALVEIFGIIVCIIIFFIVLIAMGAI